jgi:glycosyltransferase involved in cell wall biosynthesis
MAMEVPVVATRAGGVSELIDDQIDRLLVEPHSPEKAAEAIERLARDDRLATQIGARGRRSRNNSTAHEVPRS